MMAADEGTPRMIEIANYVRQGANAYLPAGHEDFELIRVAARRAGHLTDEAEP